MFDFELLRRRVGLKDHKADRAQPALSVGSPKFIQSMASPVNIAGLGKTSESQNKKVYQAGWISSLINR